MLKGWPICSCIVGSRSSKTSWIACIGETQDNPRSPGGRFWPRWPARSGCWLRNVRRRGPTENDRCVRPGPGRRRGPRSRSDTDPVGNVAARCCRDVLGVRPTNRVDLRCVRPAGATKRCWPPWNANPFLRCCSSVRTGSAPTPVGPNNWPQIDCATSATTALDSSLGHRALRLRNRRYPISRRGRDRGVDQPHQTRGTDGNTTYLVAPGDRLLRQPRGRDRSGARRNTSRPTVNADNSAKASAARVRSAIAGAAPGSIVLAHMNHPHPDGNAVTSRPRLSVSGGGIDDSLQRANPGTAVRRKHFADNPGELLWETVELNHIRSRRPTPTPAGGPGRTALDTYPWGMGSVCRAAVVARRPSAGD